MKQSSIMNVCSTRRRFRQINSPSIRVRYSRRLNYIRYLLFFFIWLICVLLQLILIYTLVAAGIIFKLWLAFANNHVSFMGALIIFTIAVVAGADCLLLIDKDKAIQLMPHTFFHLYSVCPYIDTARLREFRITRVMLRHPEIFDYGFVNGKFTIIVGKDRSSSNATDHESENIVESFLVSSQTEPQNETTSTQSALSAEIQTHLLLKMPEATQTEVMSASKSSALEEQLSFADTISSNETHIVSERQPEKYDICRLILSIGREVSLFVESEQMIGDKQTKKRAEVSLNITQKAVIVYLALHEGVWIKHEKLIRDVYGECINSTKDLFNKHIARIRERIKKVTDNNFNLEVELELFERKRGEEKNDSRWRLSSSCQIPNIDYLLKWKRLIQTQKSKSVKREDWQHAARQLMKNYSGAYWERATDEKTYIGGYFVQYLKEDAFSRWAIPFFKEYRKQYIYVLQHIAEWECKMSKKLEEYNGVEKAAELYKECAYAASSPFVDPKLGEEALRKCVEMYIECDKEEEANRVCNVYAARVRNEWGEWQPERATAEMIREHGFMID